MLLLKITYRLRAHQTSQFEKIFDEQVIPLAREYTLKFLGIWRTVVGEVGEYMELWEFNSMSDFEENWPKLINDPRLQQIFTVTGPLVEGEKFTLIERASTSGQPISLK